MKKGFVHTENFKRLTEAQKIVAKRGALEAGLVIVQGPYGVGKSALTERWAVDNGAVFVRAKQTWTSRALLDELADKMGLDKRGRNQEVQARIIGRLAVSMVPLMVDEADHLIRSTPALLEVLRDITDLTGTMCFLVGMQHFASKVARYEHIASRVARVVELLPVGPKDIELTCSALCEVKLDATAIALIVDQSQGRMRLVLNALANIEQLAEANGWQAVRGADLQGRSLVVEFSGKTLGRVRPGIA